MDLYFSGGGGDGVWRPINEWIFRNAECRLVSFAYLGVARQVLKIQQESGAHNKIILDSGAFTAWTKGTEVDRGDLAKEFEAILKLPRVEAYLINLDRIPGRKGVDPTAEEVQAAMRESEENFRWLNKQFPGRVLPVFHQGEPVEYLLELAAECNYICLSPRNDLHEKLRVDWSQRMHAKIPGVKTHGLATTGFTMMSTVPWYSVDSATWTMVSAYGGILVPHGDKMRVLRISDKSGSLQDFDGHFTTISPAEQGALRRLFAERGVTEEELSGGEMHREIWNLSALYTWTRAVRVNHVYQPGLFE